MIKSVDLELLAELTSRSCVIILLSFFLISCTASQHAGTLTVKQPAAYETDEAKWFAYYEDQFDGYEGKVEPLGPGAPLIVKQAYERARAEWETKDGNATLRTFLICVPVGVALGVLLTR